MPTVLWGSLKGGCGDDYLGSSKNMINRTFFEMHEVCISRVSERFCRGNLTPSVGLTVARDVFSSRQDSDGSQVHKSGESVS